MIPQTTEHVRNAHGFSITGKLRTGADIVAREAACKACEFWAKSEPARCCHPKTGCLRWHGRRYPWRLLRACPAGAW